MIVAGVLLVLFASVLGWCLARSAAVGDEMIEEARPWWDDPNWEWPIECHRANVDEVVRDLERSL